jgi:hypothetical protein
LRAREAEQRVQGVLHVGPVEVAGERIAVRLGEEQMFWRLRSGSPLQPWQRISSMASPPRRGCTCRNIGIVRPSDGCRSAATAHCVIVMLPGLPCRSRRASSLSTCGLSPYCALRASSSSTGYISIPPSPSRNCVPNHCLTPLRAQHRSYRWAHHAASASPAVTPSARAVSAVLWNSTLSARRATSQAARAASASTKVMPGHPWSDSTRRSIPAFSRFTRCVSLTCFSVRSPG